MKKTTNKTEVDGDKFTVDIKELRTELDKFGSSLFPVGTGGLDAYGMMTGDDTGGDVWTVAGAWEGLACRRGAA